MATAKSMTLTEAVRLLKEAGVPYGGQAGSTLRTSEQIADYVGANLVTSGGLPKGTASPTTSVKYTGGKASVVDAQGRPIKGDTTFAPAGTGGGGGTGGAGATGSTVTGGGSGTGAGYVEASSRLGGNTGGAATTTKGTDYQMADERRLSGLELDQYRNFYSRMKGGRAAPTAALLAPYRGYGGPRSTAIGDPNTQTATKMLLGY